MRGVWSKSPTVQVRAGDAETTSLQHEGVSIIQTVNEIIEYLIKNQGEIADIVVSYRTYSGELVALANTEDPITAVGLLACVQQVMINRECADEYEDDE